MLEKTTSLTITILAALLFGICGAGIAEETGSDLFKLRAKVMEIDLTYNQIIIAEEEMTLLSHFENNKTVWDTRFLDTDELQISPEEIERGSIVRVLWKVEDGTSIAEEVMLIE